MRTLRLVALMCLAVVVVAGPAVADPIRVHGTVVSVTSDHTFVLRTDDGRTVSVDFSRDDIDPRWLRPGEGVTVVGTTRQGQIVARDVIEDDARHVQRLHGVVRSVGPGRSLVLRTDDGHTLRVDLSRDDIDMRLLTRGEGIIVVGRPGDQPGTFVARNVVQDETRRLQRVHGVVRAVGPG